MNIEEEREGRKREKINIYIEREGEKEKINI